MRIYQSILICICNIACFCCLSSCKASPWGDSPESCQSDRLSIAANLALLDAKEKQIEQGGGRTDFKVALIADSQRHVEDLDAVIGKINDRGDELDFILFLGDLTDAGLEMEYDWVCKSLKKSSLPFFPVIGNHDLLNFGEDIWRSVFGPLDYSLTFLGSKFVLFNSNKLEYAGAPDLNFVRSQAQIEAGETRLHTIAASHIPPSDSTIFDDGEADEIKEMFRDSAIRLSLHGHRHHFSFTYDLARGTFEYIVSRVENEKFGILTITRDEFKLENCTGSSCINATVK